MNNKTNEIGRKNDGLTPPPLPQKRSAAPAAAWEERRTSKRKEVTTELSFESESNVYVGFTADVSTGGIFVVTWDTVSIGSHINLSFTLPGLDNPIKVDGVVRWVREHNPTDPELWPGMGIQFENLSDDVLAVISSFVENREPIFYDD